MAATKRDAGVTRIQQVEPFMVNRNVRNERCSALQSWERQRELSKNQVISRAGSQRTVGVVMEPHLTVAYEKHVVLNSFG